MNDNFHSDNNPGSKPTVALHFFTFNCIYLERYQSFEVVNKD